MSNRLPEGPYQQIILPDGSGSFPYYVIPFDKKGRCEGPQTREHLLNACKDCSDVFLFSHGWNNDWETATKRYASFIKGFIKMRQENKLSTPLNYKPLLVGIFWPSTALIKDSEQAPHIAGEIDDAEVAEERQTVREFAEELNDRDVPRFYEITQKEKLSKSEALELASMVRPLFRSKAGELASESQASVEEIVRIWQAMSPEIEEAVDLDEIQSPSSPSGTPQPASWVGDLFKSVIPRDIIRGFTVWQMKDRAGTVGTCGVGPLLADILKQSRARVHLIGHSYGGKVVLSALCGVPLTRKVHSVLLLQPAVSHLCFAPKLAEEGRPGGYYAAPSLAEKPIVTTFSEHDGPLTKFFHKALRRDDDLGELRTAAFPDPPNRYAALGGFGPRSANQKLIPIQEFPRAYEWDPGVRIYGIDGTLGISGHGDISNTWTWWLLHNQVHPEA